MCLDGIEGVATFVRIPVLDGLFVEGVPGLDEAEIPDAVCVGGEEECLVLSRRGERFDAEGPEDHVFWAERLAHVPCAGR